MTAVASIHENPSRLNAAPTIPRTIRGMIMITSPASRIIAKTGRGPVGEIRNIPFIKITLEVILLRR
jgi:hypothetical protein